MTLGTVLRSHAGGYLVYQDKLDVALKCQARGRLKKERVSIVTGDYVELEELEPESGTAVITRRLPRQNLLSRPQLANADQVLIVQALHQPEWNPLLCDKYIVHFQLELPSSLPVLCFNKCDLTQRVETEAVRSIYERLGYFVMILSAKSGEGMEQLGDILYRKISVLAGPSGVGKSSLLNYLEPSLHLKVGIVEDECGVARHTTTYSELYRIGMKSSAPDPEQSGSATWVADTPGFNLAELRHPQPADVFWQFPEIAALSGKCKFSNCLHLVEQDCNVIANIGKRTKQQRSEAWRVSHAERSVCTRGGGKGTAADGALDGISPPRYESYCVIVREAQSEYKARKSISQKVEANVKLVGGRQDKGRLIPRLSSKHRASSRRSEKQQVSQEMDLEAN